MEIDIDINDMLLLRLGCTLCYFCYQTVPDKTLIRKLNYLNYLYSVLPTQYRQTLLVSPE